MSSQRGCNNWRNGLDLIHSLKKKYGGTIEDVLAFGNQAERKLQALEQRTRNDSIEPKAIAEKTAKLWKVGTRLSEARSKVIPAASQSGEQQLGDLGFKQSRMDVSIATLDTKALKGSLRFEQSDSQMSSSGLDEVEFQFEPIRASRRVR